jgi:hypothetical protein
MHDFLKKYKGIGLWFNPFFYIIDIFPRLILQKFLTLTIVNFQK